MTEADGLFVLSGVPAGDVTIDVQPPGYEAKKVKVGPSTTTITIPVELSVTEVITIVERAPVLVRTNLQNGAAVVKGEDLTRVTSQTIDDAMQAKVTGANIQQNSGAPGGGKTTTASQLVGIALHKQIGVVVCDPQRDSGNSQALSTAP